MPNWPGATTKAAALFHSTHMRLKTLGPSLTITQRDDGKKQLRTNEQMAESVAGNVCIQIIFKELFTMSSFLHFENQDYFFIAEQYLRRLMLLSSHYI